MTAVLPEVSLARVLTRVDAIWDPDGAAHHLLLGQTGAGKTTLVLRLLSLATDSRVLVLDPKQHADPVHDTTPAGPRPVTTVGPMFGAGQEGGGPSGLWFRLVGTPDRADTERRFRSALEIVAAEGHTVLIVDDVREVCRQLHCGETVDSIMSTVRSANVLTVLCATEAGFVAGRYQASMTWVGYTGGNLPTAKAGADLLGWRGRDAQDLLAGVRRHQWVFSERETGSAGPCLVTG